VKINQKDKTIKPLHFLMYFWLMVAIAVCGLASSVYLSISHYRVYVDMAYKSFCAVSKAINCDTVSQSPYSVFLNVPVPVWGVVGYSFFLSILFFALQARQQRQGLLWPSLFFIAAVFSIYSIILAYISYAYIHSYCLMCVVSYAVNFMLLYVAWLVHRRLAHRSVFSGIVEDIRYFWSVRKFSLGFCAVFLTLVVTLMATFPAYWKLSALPSQTTIPTGMTLDGHPWIGAETPRLVITEFTDYRCFQCRKMHFYLRQLVSRHPDKLRLVHRHFPMDHTINPIVKQPFHVGSAKMSLLSIYAAQKNKFWLINDMLFNTDATDGNFNVRKMAKAAEFDVYEFAAAVKNPFLRNNLKKDIREGIELGIFGTPGYLIDGQVYAGHVPPEIIRQILD